MPHTTLKSQDDKILTIFRPPGAVDAGAFAQIEKCLEHERAVAGALMADHHLGYSMPIGGVIAYDGAISPSGVGFDIACGNMCVKTDINFMDVSHPQNGIKPIMREIQRQVAFGMGRNNPTPVYHPLFEDPVWPELEAQSANLKKLAADQLGTVGSGNHYVDLLVDKDNTIWIANHFGSRGLGHKIASGFLNLAADKAFTDHAADTEEPTVLDLDTDLGAFYLEAMTLAGAYAYAGREYVIQQVLSILGAQAVFSVHNHHNFAWYEHGQWIVRKGATPLTTQPAFIGGSMGDPSVIVRGKILPKLDPAEIDVVLDQGNLGSAPHGAGRVMSRTKAAGKFRKFFVCINNRNCPSPYMSLENAPGGKCPTCGIPLNRRRMRDTTTALIDWDAEREKLNARGIVVLGAGADESPGVYKTLENVLSVHENIEVLHVLEPVGVVMAGPDTYDPFAD